MKIVSILIIAIMLTACTTGLDPNFSAGWNASMSAISNDKKPPKNRLNLLVDKIVSEMLSNNQYVNNQHSIAVTSMVELDNFSSTTRLGLQISEGIVHYLHANGYRVVDFKLTGQVKVTPDGDYAHSRDWKALKNSLDIDYLVSGTLDEYEGGIYLNVRMVGVHSQVVVASSQTFISAEQLHDYVYGAESKAMAAQRAQLEAERVQFASDVEHLVEQKVEDALYDKMMQQESDIQAMNDAAMAIEPEIVIEPEIDEQQEDKKVRLDNGFLVRE